MFLEQIKIVFNYLLKIQEGKEKYDEDKFSSLIDVLEDEDLYQYFVYEGITYNIIDFILTMNDRSPYNYLFI